MKEDIKYDRLEMDCMVIELSMKSVITKKKKKELK